MRSDYWNLGHKLFRSSQETFPATFLAGDCLNPDFVGDSSPLKSGGPAEVPRPTLSTLTTLAPLRGHVSAIHIGNVFHLFTEEQQAYLARVLAGLLSFEPGSIIVGSHSASNVKGFRTSFYGGSAITQFCHCPESWTALWDGEVFEKGTVKVDTKLYEHKDALGAGSGFYGLSWSVMRV
ncbi:hypothetical protein BD311DRAFT_704019 [Dichomitus squalens]|uniref:Uncharacterized protein n=1 Tax=Dichomitus squalens TaxID=114155 RepID=A0A4Q9MC90_9APHY|nr:hypothetical protein BD311DRAFT_704019 [Dichomitus squalens]